MRECRPVLECQVCGDVLQELSDAQAQEVARNPYNFVGFCAACKALGAHIEEGFE